MANKNVSQMSNAELNNMIKKLGNNTKAPAAAAATPAAATTVANAPKVNTPAATNAPKANTPAAANASANASANKKNNTKINEGNNENNNNNNNNNNDNNNDNNNNKNKTNKKEDNSFIDKSINSISNTINNIKNKIISPKNNEEKTNENKKNNTNNTTNKKYIVMEPEGDTIWSLIIKIIIMIVVLLIIYYLGKYLINRYLITSSTISLLLDGSKNAKNALVISQDPNSVNYIPINKSDGQDGIQFSYGFWFLIQGYDYKKGEWKHIFHKGNSSSYPNRAPGVWLHPDKNSVRVYMNTLDNIMEYADVDNLPINKWIYMNVILDNKNLDLYINGYLKIRKELSSLPKQNDDDFWVSMFGGFEGYVSNIKYYAYVIDFYEINNMINAGPSVNNCIDTGEIPPYLDDNWWFGYEG